MNDKPAPNYRMERITRLLMELKYEVTRGMMEREVDECLGFEFYVPISNSPGYDVVVCRFETRPDKTYAINPENYQPRLRVVK